MSDQPMRSPCMSRLARSMRIRGLCFWSDVFVEAVVEVVAKASAEA